MAARPVRQVILRRHVHNYGHLRSYKPTGHLAQLAEHAPSHRIQLANETPLHRWSLPGISRTSFNVFVKRDDLTHGAAAGNKIRKLEFLLGEAFHQQANVLLTCGGVQSNHVRATVALGRELGMSSHVVLRSEENEKHNLPQTGNFFLDLLLGSKVTLVPKKSPYASVLKPTMEQLAESYADAGKRCYHIPVGGSDTVGLWGYLEAFACLQEQCEEHDITDIVLPTGSGGTACGLAIANHLAGSPFKITALAICDNNEYFYTHVQQTLDALGLSSVDASSILTVNDSFKGAGYGLFNPEVEFFIISIAQTSGIILDHTYTGKAAHGMQSMMLRSPELFQGHNVCFLHTGGIFGLMDGRISLP